MNRWTNPTGGGVHPDADYLTPAGLQQPRASLIRSPINARESLPHCFGNLLQVLPPNRPFSANEVAVLDDGHHPDSVHGRAKSEPILHDMAITVRALPERLHRLRCQS